MRVTTSDGAELYYERRGVGPRLLFLNGSGATLETSEPLISALAARFDVVAHDQRGLGRTSIPPGPYGMADYASDAGAVMDDVGWPGCRVLGVSFGGMVAQEFAVTWPARVERLALLSTSPGGTERASYPLHELALLDTEERRAVSTRILDTRFTPDWLAKHPDDRALAEMAAERRLAPKTDDQRRGETEQLEARRHHDVWERLDRISCPCLVACGRFDGIAPPGNSQAIATRIPNAELRIYEGGHLFFAQDATALPDIISFLTA